MTEDELRKYIENPDVVESVIFAINSAIEVPAPHTIYSYFQAGHCNIYAEILVQIFEGYATPLDNGDHIIVRIGEYYFDVDGFIPKWRMGETPFLEMSVDQLYDMPYMGLGAFPNDIDNKIIETAVKIGKEHLQSLIEDKFGSIVKSK